MFRLKMAKKPKLFKLKFNFIFPQIVLANMQEKEITPTKEIQIVEPDRNYDGLSKVIVDKIPDEYIIPQGDLEISQNGTYDVTDKASANVNVQPNLQEKIQTITENGTTIFEPDTNYDGLSRVEVNINTPVPAGTLDITENGNYNVKEKEFANVNVPTKTLGTKTITANGTYLATDDGVDGYSEVKVATGKYAPRYIRFADYNGTELDYEVTNLDTSNVTNMSSMFSYCERLTNLDLSNFDTTKVTNMSKMFYVCSSLTSLDLSSFNTSNVTNMSQMFQNCSSLTSLNLSSFNTSNVTNMWSMFTNCSSLKNLNISNFDFTKTISYGNYDNLFQNVPSDCYILVKDATAKEWITSKFTTLTNVHYVGEE